jgi:hypothetical protein
MLKSRRWQASWHIPPRIASRRLLMRQWVAAGLLPVSQPAAAQAFWGRAELCHCLRHV